MAANFQKNRFFSSEFGQFFEALIEIPINNKSLKSNYTLILKISSKNFNLWLSSIILSEYHFREYRDLRYWRCVQLLWSFGHESTFEFSY